MRSLLLTPFFLLLLSVAAAAQGPPDLVRAHYRAYRTALERGDLQTAESEAGQALGLSEARDGDGGSTPVLLLNLATIRLMLGDPQGAMSPALHAHALAQAGAAGVDPMHAALIVGRAELATQGQAGATRLSDILGGEEGDALPASEVYPAAFELGLWASRERDFETARMAWATAASHAEGAPLGRDYGFGRARTGEAASIILDEIGRRGGSRMNLANAHEAYRLLEEAVEALSAAADIDAPNLELTIAQQAFAEARAWQLALTVKLRADDQRLPDGAGEAQGDADGFTEMGPLNLTVPRCLVRLETSPMPEFPDRQMARGGLGALVLRLRINEAGEVVESQTIARVGSEDFSEEVDRVSRHWRVIRREDFPPNCRMDAVLLAPVGFVIQR